MQDIWIIAALAAGALALIVLVAVPWRGRRTYVSAEPLTISVTDPVEDVLESPAERRANRARPDVSPG